MVQLIDQVKTSMRTFGDNWLTPGSPCHRVSGWIPATHRNGGDAWLALLVLAPAPERNNRSPPRVMNFAQVGVGQRSQGGTIARTVTSVRNDDYDSLTRFASADRLAQTNRWSCPKGVSTIIQKKRERERERQRNTLLPRLWEAIRVKVRCVTVMRREGKHKTITKRVREHTWHQENVRGYCHEEL